MDHLAIAHGIAVDTKHPSIVSKQDVQEEDMEDEGMEEVGEMGDSDGMDSSEETVHDLTSPQ